MSWKGWRARHLGFKYELNGKELAVDNGLELKHFGDGTPHLLLTQGPSGAVQAIFGCSKYHEAWAGPIPCKAQAATPEQRVHTLVCLKSCIKQREKQEEKARKSGRRDAGGHDMMLRTIVKCFDAIRAMDKPEEELPVQKKPAVKPSVPAATPTSTNSFDLLPTEESASESSSDDEMGDERNDDSDDDPLEDSDVDNLSDGLTDESDDPNDDALLRCLDNFKLQQYDDASATRGDGDGSTTSRKRE